MVLNNKIEVRPSIKIDEMKIIQGYRSVMYSMLRYNFPKLTSQEIMYGINRSISESFKDNKVTISNNYKKRNVNINLSEVAEFLMSKKPIMTSYGVMFTRHSDRKNPIYDMIDRFITQRNAKKKEMFKYPKGSQDFAKYNLAQQLLKTDANSYYGSSGNNTSIYYNIYCAGSTTCMGRSAISAASLLFESILANNVPFASLNELIDFIYNVERDEMVFNDKIVISHVPSVEETFAKLILSCGFRWIPDEEEMNIIWNIVSSLSQETITRLYYKNNLYEFCNNEYVSNLLITILVKLNEPFINPNSIPPEVQNEMDMFKKLIFEYVYYHHQIIDKLDKMDVLIRDVSIIQDTDSSIVSFDAWYRYILNKTKYIDMPIKNSDFDPIEEKMTGSENTSKYSFEDDKIIEQLRTINPIKIIPQDNLRYSIISIIANTISFIVNDFMFRFAHQYNSDLPKTANLPKGGKCMLMMKNEFLFYRLLLTNAKKHYSSKQELQEGNKIPEEESLDVKGMEAFVKSGTSIDTRNKLKKILYEDIINCDNISQEKVISELSMIEKEIYNSIINGEKKYFKPSNIKSESSYTDPMRIQGIKASVAYNELHQEGTESIDLRNRNGITIAKVNINKNNIYKIQEEFPDVYKKVLKLMDNNYFKAGITSIAIPLNEEVPKWLIPFIDFSKIINDNIVNFPLSSISIRRSNPANNNTNIISSSYRTVHSDSDSMIAF